MTESISWETVEIPKGAFVGWGTNAGQHVTGKVLDYSPAGGTDFNNEPCPQLTVELVEAAASFNKAGDRTDFPAGEIVNLTVGQSALKGAIKRSDPSVGDLIKITMTGTTRTTKGNTLKEFDLKIARGATPAPAPQAPAQDYGSAPVQAQPPF